MYGCRLEQVPVVQPPGFPVTLGKYCCGSISIEVGTFAPEVFEMPVYPMEDPCNASAASTVLKPSKVR